MKAAFPFSFFSLSFWGMAVCFFLVSGCGQGEPKLPPPGMPLTTVEFDSLTYDFGTVPAGTQVEHPFRFTNTGDHPLHITDVRTTCHCTTSDYPKEAIAPGGSGVITLVVDTKGMDAKVGKGTMVYLNVEGYKIRLVIRGEVSPVK